MDSCRGTLQVSTNSLSIFPSHTACFSDLSHSTITRETNMIGGTLFSLSDLIVSRSQLEYILFFPSQRERLIHEYFTIINYRIIVWSLRSILTQSPSINYAISVLLFPKPIF
jgi:hypothetical protein